MAKGDLVFVDDETTGLDWSKHTAIEIAYVTQEMEVPKVIIPWVYKPGEYGYPWYAADAKAMEINKFFDRYDNGVERSSDEDIAHFLEVVKDSTLVGANVRFDARFIESTLNLEVELWHYRLWDITSYSAGVFGLDHLEGWSDIKKRIDVINKRYYASAPVLTTSPDHSAAADCQSVKECFNWLQWYSNQM